jgi:dienelactone hydrolase
MTRSALLAFLFAILAASPTHAELPGVTFDASNVRGPNSGAAMELWKPADAGPHPAVVIMHGCGGVSSNHRSWASRIASWGYVGAMIDSFGPRHVKSTCNVGGEPTPNTRAQDAYSAAIYLRTLPDIVPDKIGLIGFSHGGSTVLQAVQTARINARQGARPFQAAVAYYPGCGPNPPYNAASTDVLILIGKDDDWASAANCEKLVIGKKDFEHPPKIKVYPGAVHGFDSGGLPQWTGDHMVGGNAEAAADSFIMTKAFLDEHLKAR